jgi:hypothetical protein
MLRSLAVVCAAMLVSGTAISNPDLLPERPRDPTSATQGQGVEAPVDFGSSNTYYQAVDGTSFHPRFNSTPYERGTTTGAYYCAPGATQSVARAQVGVPHGVRLSSFRAWMFDSLATHSVSVTLQSVCQPDSTGGDPIVTDLGTINSTVPFGAGNFSDFDNGSVGFVTDNQSCVYRVEVAFPQGCPSTLALGVQKARVSWQRFTPVAPTVATFTDVPLGSMFFREIEALVASGITLGCTPTLFCPDVPLSRGQMAAFLARALGLPPATIADPANP